jgi:F-type H+-transporting ATPase subunit epsilon
MKFVQKQRKRLQRRLKMSSMQVDVVSATESLYSGEAKCVFAPASTGELGIYPKHTALLSTLKPGEVRIETDKGVESIYVSGGIVEIQPDVVTIFSDTAIRASDLNEAKALEAKQRAEAAMEGATENQDISATQAALAESMAQLQMISKMRGKKA